jgi:hypothetical protein
MKKNDKAKSAPQTKKSGARQITRREFTIASVAALGTSPLALAHMDESPPPFKLDISDDVDKILNDRHILNSDLVQVIQYAEKTGEKLYRTDDDHFLAKFKLNTVYFYAEYSAIEGGYRIHNAYSHRFTLEGSM